jgi:hypothetical protein
LSTYDRALAIDPDYALPEPVLARLRTDIGDPIKEDVENALPDMIADSLGGVIYTKSTIEFTTAELQPNARQNILIDLGSSFHIRDVKFSSKARLRAYTTVAARTADSTRIPGIDPVAGTNHGVILDVLLNGYLETDPPFVFTPQIIGAIPEGIAVPMLIDNLDTASQIITVQLTYRRMD